MVKALHQSVYSGRGNLKSTHDLQTQFKQFKPLRFLQYVYHNGNVLNVNGRLNPDKQFSENRVDTSVTSWLPYSATDPRKVLRGHDDTNYIQLLAIDSQPGKDHRGKKFAEEFIAGPVNSPRIPYGNNNQEI